MLKKPLLTLILTLAFFAGDALAQCGGKTVSIKFPSEWGANTYVYFVGSFTRITGTNDGGWTTFTLPNLTNDNATATIVILDYYDLYNQNGITHIITKNGFSSDKSVPSTGLLTCSDFGPDGTWIMEDPTRPGKIVISTTPPDAYYFYFLPPNGSDWVLGTPYLVYGPNKAKIRLELDTDRCGWYKYMWYNEPLPSGDAWIYLDNGENYNKLGLLGFNEDPLEWPTGQDPTPFNLLEQYGNKPGNLFLTPSSYPIWRSTDPGLNGICQYSFAAIIYQRTSYSSTGGFSWYCDPQFDACTSSDTRTFGICKGLVKPDLDANGKMEWAGNNCASPYGGVALGGWENATNFNNAFKETAGQNKRHCYDMPFTRRPSGWEFDSYYLCKDGITTDYNSTYNSGCGTGMGGIGNVGGFYNMKDVEGTALGVRNYDGDRIGVIKDYQWCFDRGWSGTGVGDLSNATTAAAINAEMSKVCTAQYPTSATANGTLGDQTEAHCPWYGKSDFSQALQAACPYNEASQPKGVRGGHLCFESQDAEFTYKPGQEFFFRGDDDIWVFINNRLVIDLGGAHTPAPGYVKLDTITQPSKLVEGKKYPIKIFFCDRRGPGSNVRIATNIYFAQKSGLFLKEGSAGLYGDICLKTSGGGSCAAAAGSGPTEQCGLALDSKLAYYIQRRDGTGRIDLNASNPNCVSQGDGSLDCYGSIKIHLASGKVGIEAQKTQGLVGTWEVLAEIKDGIVQPKPMPLMLGIIAGRTSIQVVWGTIKNETGQTITTIPYKNMSGKTGMEAVASKLIPVGFAQGAWITETNASFAVDMDASPGSFVRLQPSSAIDPSVLESNLRIFRDAAGTIEASINEDFTIPASGVLVLYFTGDFAAHGTATYNINSQASGEPFALKVYQPKIEFINNNYEPIPQSERWGSDPAKPGTTVADRSVYVSTTLSRKIAAFDPVEGGICTTCNFNARTETSILYGVTTSIDNSIIEFSDKRIENGIGNLTFSGLVNIEGDNTASFTVGGPSPDPSTIARWERLQFISTPIPYPINAEIFDRNGDGKGDSILVVYNRKFPEDSLPNKLQIVWSLGDTVSFGLANLDGNGRYTNAGIDISANRKYWAPYLRKGAIQDSISIAVPYDAQFSSGIKTAAYGGESIFSWTTFADNEGRANVTAKFDRSITDRISPIIVKAEYLADEDTNCGTPERKCRDRLFIELSEKVKMAEGVVSSDNVKRAFAYYLMAGDPGFRVYDEAKSLATSIVWGGKANFPEGDSSVQLTYMRYKTKDDYSFTPVSNDSVRFLASGANPTSHAFVDMEGNFPNPNEIGRRITNSSSTPIAIPKAATASQIIAKAIGNAIMLENLPKNAKVQVYNLHGKRIYNSPFSIFHSQFITVHAKGLYIVKVQYGKSNREFLKVLVK